MDTKILLALTWFFAVLAVICGSLMYVLTSVKPAIDAYSAAVCVDGQLRAVSAGGQSYVLRRSDNNEPLKCEAQ